jgi:hypothetical protein
MARPALPAMRQGSWASAHISYKEESVSTAPPPNLTTSSMSSSNDASGLLSPRTQQLEIGSRERDRLVEKRMQDAEQRAAAAEQRALTAERLLAVVCGSIEPPITSRWPSSECCLMRTDTDALLVIVLSLCCHCVVIVLHNQQANAQIATLEQTVRTLELALSVMEEGMAPMPPPPDPGMSSRAQCM